MIHFLIVEKGWLTFTFKGQLFYVDKKKPSLIAYHPLSNSWHTVDWKSEAALAYEDSAYGPWGLVKG